MTSMSLGRVDRYPAPDGVPALMGPRPEAATVAPRPDGSMLSPYHTQPEASSVRTMAQYAPDTGYLAHYHTGGYNPNNVVPHIMNTTVPGGKAETVMGGLLVAVIVGVLLMRGRRF